jgi:MFS family permease
MRRPLRFLLASYVLVGSVDWVLAVALTTVVFDRTGSAGWVAATVALRFLPSVVLAPLSGVLADRFDRRYLLAASSGLRLMDLLLLRWRWSTPCWRRPTGRRRSPSCPGSRRARRWPRRTPRWLAPCS